MTTTTTPLQDHVGLRAPLLFAAIILLGFGLSYSLAGATLGRVLFPAAATGTPTARHTHAIGPALVPQPSPDGRYFQPPPSAANYDPMAAAGSNMARSNPDLRTRIAELTLAVAEREGIAPAQVPAELVTQSGGGLDPHLSPRAVQVQVARVAKARGIDIPTVERVLARHIEAPQFGVLGQARVNVLQLNLALDALSR